MEDFINEKGYGSLKFEFSEREKSTKRASSFSWVHHKRRCTQKECNHQYTSSIFFFYPIFSSLYDQRNHYHRIVINFTVDDVTQSYKHASLQTVVILNFNVYVTKSMSIVSVPLMQTVVCVVHIVNYFIMHAHNFIARKNHFAALPVTRRSERKKKNLPIL